MNLNKLRNQTIDATVRVLNKAKAKPPSTGTTLRNIIDDPCLSNADKLSALAFLQTEIANIKDDTNA